MDIEEERKAFVAALNDCPIYSEWEFGIWIKAKKHAIEMAKPAAYIRQSEPGMFVVCEMRDKRVNLLKILLTEADAKSWIVDNGYRQTTIGAL